jgi:hypothetical protein
MATDTTQGADGTAVRDRWLGRMAGLVDDVERWAREADWSTRRIDKSMEDPQFGAYRAPGLMLQKEFTRVMLEPMGWSTDAEAIADLYEMPAYDDVARLAFERERWHVLGLPPVRSNDGGFSAEVGTPLSKDELLKVLEALRGRGA